MARAGHKGELELPRGEPQLFVVLVFLVRRRNVAGSVFAGNDLEYDGSDWATQEKEVSGMFKGLFGGGAAAGAPRLAADAAQAIANDENHDELRADGREAVAQNVDAKVKRPPDFLDKLYPPVPEPREFSAAEVWERSQVSDDEQQYVARAQQLLGGLPEDTPDAVKQQIVEAAFKAFDVSIEDIVSAATHEVQALRDYIADANARAERFKAVSEERIGELEAEIKRIRGTIGDVDSERVKLIGSASEVIEKIEPVLYFFGDTGGATEPGMGRPSVPAGLSSELDERAEDAVHLDEFADVDTTVAVPSQLDGD